jgi:hypothetical protein
MTRVSATEWRKRVKAWTASGQAADVFGDSKGFDGRQLQWWKWKFSRDERTRSSSRPAFVPAHVEGSPAPRVRAGFEVTFASGVVVRIPAGFSPTALADLLTAVGALSC